jgi:hypothetical protein
MTPILGILASGISGNLWQPGKDFDSIATVTPYTTTTTVVFSSIPSTYRHLQLRASAANTGAAVNLRIRVNGDAGSNYSFHYISANGASVFAGGGASNTGYDAPVITSTASAFTGMVIDFLDYKDTNKNKTMRSLSGVDLNGSNTWLELKSGVWTNTSAINSITIDTQTGAIAANSHWALYGIK